MNVDSGTVAHCLKIDDEKYDWLASSDNLLFVCNTYKGKRAGEESLSNAALSNQMKDMLANTQVQVILENQNKMMKTNGDLAFHVNKCRMPLREYQKIE